MKALFTLLFLASFSLQHTIAQTSKAIAETWVPVQKAGVKGGVNVASVSNLANSSAFLGLHGGFFGEIRPREAFGYGGEVMFSKQGVTASNLDFSLNYLSVPVFLNLYHGKVTFQGGGYGALLFMATAKMGQDKKDITDNFQTTDYGLLVGLRFRPLDKTFIGLRFNLGLQNINNNFTKNSAAVLRNRNIQVSAGYQF
ncbi:PorT family protein [Adhaeribacter sp. BT258]|uniref:PorT family protein n=1 Tax=Adhaeribacter terrigena TaxID=2793070 RepID=A0ABS1C1C0_9BACT|nr:porin family protein [Adhaeribacter terrigena]MBK0403201.1 PorT family protein [Adhaeribacter terrigena]